MTASLTTLKPLNLTTTDSYTFANVSVTANVSATGNVSGTYFIGNGSQLTGISAGGTSNARVMGYNLVFGG